jgi:hypothetical protein
MQRYGRDTAATGRIDEQVLERAEADPQWRQQFIEDPLTAIGDIPEARQLRQMLDSARHSEQHSPAVTVLAPREEYRQLQRSLTEKVLDRAASYPA